MDEKEQAILLKKKVGELREIAKAFGIEGYESMKKQQLLGALIDGQMPEEQGQGEEDWFSRPFAPAAKTETIQAESEYDDAGGYDNDYDGGFDPPDGLPAAGEGFAGEPPEMDIPTDEPQDEELLSAMNIGEAPGADDDGDQMMSEKEKNRYEVEGILELSESGFGFLRFENFLSGPNDV
jgi:transcription termination factor Rho